MVAFISTSATGLEISGGETGGDHATKIAWFNYHQTLCGGKILPIVMQFSNAFKGVMLRRHLRCKTARCKINTVNVRVRAPAHLRAPLMSFARRLCSGVTRMYSALAVEI